MVEALEDGERLIHHALDSALTLDRAPSRSTQAHRPFGFQQRLFQVPSEAGTVIRFARQATSSTLRQMGSPQENWGKYLFF